MKRKDVIHEALNSGFIIKPQNDGTTGLDPNIFLFAMRIYEQGKKDGYKEGSSYSNCQRVLTEQGNH